jgi:hypothetical protein
VPPVRIAVDPPVRAPSAATPFARAGLLIALLFTVPGASATVAVREYGRDI